MRMVMSKCGVLMSSLQVIEPVSMKCVMLNHRIYVSYESLLSMCKFKKSLFICESLKNNATTTTEAKKQRTHQKIHESKKHMDM